MYLITDFASDRAALTASSTAGSLAASNMQRNEKAAVWRSTGTTATITVTWTVAEAIDSVAIGWTNLTGAATVTISLFALADDASPVASITVSPDASQVQAWLPASYLARKVVVEIDDQDTAAGYVEVSRLCVGKRVEISPPEYGVPLKFVDRSKSSRAESGDLRVEPASVHRVIDLDFAYLSAGDVEVLMLIAARGAGAVVFVALFPGDAVALKRQAYAFFASPSADSFSYPFINRWSNKLTLEEIA